MLIAEIGGLLERLIVVDAENGIAANIVVEDEATGFWSKVAGPSNECAARRARGRGESRTERF